MIDQPHEQKPALTVVIQSWWTPALAVVSAGGWVVARLFWSPTSKQECGGWRSGCSG